MSILSSELKAYRAQTHNDTSTNGGTLSGVEIVSGVKNNVWPDAPQAELDAGSTKWRKIFLKVDNAENIDLQNAKAYIENFTPGQDRVVCFPGTASDIQSDIATPRLFGAGQLNADVIATATTLTVSVEEATDVIFQDGDTIRISDKTDINDGTGTSEFATISGIPSYAGNIATITLAAGLTNAYTADTPKITRVASVIDGGTVGTTNTTPAVVGGGTVDDTFLVVENIGAVDDDWTLTFTSSTNFNITRANPAAGDDSLTGTTATITAPVNQVTGTPYFTMQTTFFSGAFAASDTVDFTTTSATLPVWEQRDIPLGASSLTANSVKLVLQGESAS